MLTPKIAKDLRLSIGVSQKTVCEAIGMPVSELSKFENGRINPTPAQIRKLSNYYQELIDPEAFKKIEGSAEDEPAPASLFEIDGIVIPEGFDVDEAQSMMDTYRENAAYIRAQLTQPAPRGLLGWLKIEKLMVNVLVPMAENFAIIDRLQGGSDAERIGVEIPSLDELDEHGPIETVQDALEHLFSLSATIQAKATDAQDEAA